MACVVILPQMPLFELEQELSSLALSFVLSLESKLHIFSYFGVQLVFALDQFIAVYWPFKHARLRRHLNYGTITGVCVLVGILQASDTVTYVETGSAHVFGLLHRIVTTAIGFTFIIALPALYSATAFKLYRQNSIKPQHIHLRDVAAEPQGTEVTEEQSVKVIKRRSMHIQALKIYAAIFVQFVLCIVVSGVLINILKQRWTSYFFFINHICNPVIYFCFVPKFREGVCDVKRKLCGG